MKTMISAIVVTGALLLLAGISYGKGAACPPDMVQAGPVCVDKYEASVWEVAPANTALVKKIKSGTATAAGLTAGGALPRGLGSADYPCNEDGNDCIQIYALSIPGAMPAAFINWFQAQQACANSGKRLLTNAEWQLAAAGTPDPGTDNGTTDCNIAAAGAVLNSGARASCVSRFGVFDMVGKLDEWVADWVPPAGGSCGAAFIADDANCLAGSTPTAGTHALHRGGSAGSGTGAGVFSVTTDHPLFILSLTGFRCGR